MEIKQWEDKNLSHFSYAILSDCEKKIVLVDPSRDPGQYLEYARSCGATIIGVIETHPHADFVSSHAEIQERTNAPVYVSKLVNAGYPHQSFDEGNSIEFGKIKLTPINTPGHSPDSISILLVHDGKPHAVFTGDTLFIGDCGRPDLREGAGEIKASRDDLAAQMYHSLREKLATLPGNVIVYPAHGAGTLCGKALSKAFQSTIDAEKLTNWSLQEMSKEQFVKELLSDQPFVPAYFPYDVEVNKQGAPPFQASVEKIKIDTDAIVNISGNQQRSLIIDGRHESSFKKAHLPFSVNVMEDGKFETWLGSIIHPDENFYLAGEDEKQLQRLIARAASIGYENKIRSAVIVTGGSEKTDKLDLRDFKEHPEKYTIVDVRNVSEVKEKKIFDQAIAIPLAELRMKVKDIPVTKPVVVHCAGGYRSAAGSSIIQSVLGDNVKVYDLGDAVTGFTST